MLAEEVALPELRFPASPIADRFSLFRVAPRVLVDNRASASHTVIEVNGRDRRGFLYALTRAISRLRLQISSAKISTFGARAVDVFYVKDQYGLKVENGKRVDAIRAGLMEALTEGQPSPSQIANGMAPAPLPSGDAALGPLPGADPAAESAAQSGSHPEPASSARRQTVRRAG